MTPQYYIVKLRSHYYYDDDKRIIVDGLKDLKKVIKQYADYFRGLDNELFPRTFSKRMHTGQMRQEPDEKIVGKVFTFNLLAKDIRTLTDEQIEDYHDQALTFWCQKIPKKELYRYSGFGVRY